MTSKHQRRPAVRPPRDRHPRHRVRRRDEEGRLHHHELPDAQARRAVDALLGHRGRRRRHLDPLVRPVGHRQDDAVGRSEAQAHRRRRALLERRRHLQHRGRLLRQGHRPVARRPSRRSTTRCASAPCSRTWSTTRDREVDYDDTSITENTRGSYPIEFIDNAKIPCVGGHPKNVIFLTCDAFGVLPPVSQADARAGDVPLHQRLHRQGRRHRGGRHRAGGDVLACFGGPFLVWHPAKYAELLAEKIRSTAPTSGWSTPAGPAAPTAPASA
jgi:hypothetical protein